jgi:hypothetical protein
MRLLIAVAILLRFLHAPDRLSRPKCTVSAAENTKATWQHIAARGRLHIKPSACCTRRKLSYTTVYELSTGFHSLHAGFLDELQIP